MAQRLSERLSQSLRLAPEGRRFVGITLGLWALAGLLAPLAAFAVSPVVAVFIFSLREPARRPPGDSSVFVAPSSGRVRDIELLTLPEVAAQPLRRIGIFLALWDVHIQRAPHEGVVESISYRSGAYRAAFRPHASHANAANTVVLTTHHGPMVVRQIAGVMGRRILCRVGPGVTVAKGERLGSILFGSRVELYLPVEIQVRVRIGDRVVDGETIVGAVAPGRVA